MKRVVLAGALLFTGCFYAQKMELDFTVEINDVRFPDTISLDDNCEDLKTRSCSIEGTNFSYTVDVLETNKNEVAIDFRMYQTIDGEKELIAVKRNARLSPDQESTLTVADLSGLRGIDHLEISLCVNELDDQADA